MGLIPGLGRSPGEGNGNSPQDGNWKWQLLSLAWETPWTEAPSGLQSMGSQNRHNSVTEQQHDGGRDNVYSFASIIFSLRYFRSFHNIILSPSLSPSLPSYPLPLTPLCLPTGLGASRCRGTLCQDEAASWHKGSEISLLLWAHWSSGYNTMELISKHLQVLGSETGKLHT